MDVPGFPDYSNHLGSASVITGATGIVVEQTDYFPYGGSAYQSGTDPNHYKFTGKERDSESGLDNFGARYFTSALGRFMTPDWAARPTAVPYAVFGDPQSLNLYTYVRNDPVTRADADGHTGQRCYSDFSTPVGPVCTPVANKPGGPIDGPVDDSAQDKKDSNPPAPPSPPTPGLPKGVPYLNTPGHHYKTKRAAAKAQIRGINPTSVREHREYAGRVVLNANGTYGVTGPNPGDRDSSSPGPVPEGTVNAARWHTHGGNDPGYDNEHFSPQDKANAGREHVDSYLGTPGGTIREYDPSTGSDVVIGNTPN